MSHYHHHYQVNRRGAYLQTPAPLNPHTDFVAVVTTASLAYSYAYGNGTLLLSGYVVSDTRYRHIDHNPLSYVQPWAINLNRGASVVPPRRGNNVSHGTFRRRTTTAEVGQIPRGRNSRENHERPSSMHSNWSREEETMILNGIDQVGDSNWSREEETMILNGTDQVGGSSEDMNAGVSEEDISKYLRTRNSNRVIRATDEDGEPDICVVCQDDLFDENQTIAELDCGHEFHTPCIKSWLRRKNACPLCKSIALPYR